MRKIFLISVCAFLFSCSHRSLNYLTREGIKVCESKRIGSGDQQEVKVQYLGCGGLFIASAKQAIMIDPFFSHQSFGHIGRAILLKSKIRSSPKQIAKGKKTIQDSLSFTDEVLRDRVKGIFVAHGHYDHMMDVPFIQQSWLDGRAPVFANASSITTCSNVIGKDKLFNIESIASIRNQLGQAIDFRNNNETIRVYPVFADHNPHARNIKLFAGSKTMTPDHYRHYKDKTFVNDWLEGQTLSFLIDFLEKDSITLRIFIQSSSCQFPNGIPPDTLLDQKPVDLAFLGVASYQFSENTYPCEFLKKLQAKNVAFIHWEDFFDRFGAKPRAIRKTNLPEFFRKIAAQCSTDYILPVPGAVITIGKN